MKYANSISSISNSLYVDFIYRVLLPRWEVVSLNIYVIEIHFGAQKFTAGIVICAVDKDIFIVASFSQRLLKL